MRDQNLVERSSPVAFKVDRYELISQSLEDSREPASHFEVERAQQIFRTKLQPHDLFMVAYAEGTKSHLAQSFLSLVHDAELLFRDARPVREARRQAGRGLLVCGGKARLARQNANLFFVQPCFNQGTANALFRGGLPSRPEIAQVVGVQAVNHEGKPPFPGNRREHAVELILAEVAPVGRIVAVLLLFDFAGVDDLMGEAELCRDFQSHPALM